MTKGCGQWRNKNILPLALPQMLHSLREPLLMFFDSPKFPSRCAPVQHNPMDFCLFSQPEESAQLPILV